MATPDELRASIAEARKAMRAALAAAGPAWEKKPAGGAGEDAWSPRQVAEHAIPLEVWFASEVCVACGYPALEPIKPEYATAAAALEGFEAAAAKADGRLKYVSDTDLEKLHEKMGPVSRVMEVNAHHLKDHAEQIEAAVAGT